MTGVAGACPDFNLLPGAAIQRMVAASEPYEFDCIYGACWDKAVMSATKQAVQRSADSYLRASKGEY